ncbi:hypothetical protein ACHWQZ_G014221 [Mnemiopsis leidyi]
MSSRLDRLLVLLDTGSTAVVRTAAAKQLGDIQQSHPLELQNLLQRVYVHLKSKTWESRIAAGEAISAIVQHVPLWGNCKVEEELCSYLTFQTFSLEDVIRHGTPLLGSIGTEFDSHSADQAASQKQRLSKELGLTVGNVNLSDDLFNDEDLIQSPAPSNFKTAEIKRSISSLLNGEETLSARERNKAKRKAKQISRQNSISGGQREGLKRQKTSECPSPPTESVLEWSTPEQHEWPLSTIVQYLLEDVLSTEWEHRHGAAIGLRSIIRKHRYTRSWLEDLSLRLVTVLALDRFGDYVSHEVVAPVRETTAQVLGIISSHLATEDMLLLQGLFLQLLGSEEWQARHGGLLAIKYLLAARQDITSQFLTALLPHVIRSVSDDDDDVRAVAAAALLPVAHSLPDKVPEDLIFGLTDKLWTSLVVLDDLSASTSSIVTLLAQLLKHKHICEYYNSGKSGESLDVLVPRLRPFMCHTIRSVRRDSLLALHVLLQIRGTWIDKIAPLFARVLYQRIFLEPEESFYSLLIKVWDELFTATSEVCRKKLATDHLPLWSHMLGAPPGLALDNSLFFKPPTGASLSVPMGPREFTLKCTLVSSLSMAAKTTDISLFTPLINNMLDSGCASHKQGACLLLQQLIDRCEVTKESVPELTSKVIKLISTPMTFDELLAVNQNLQIACRGLLSSVKDKPTVQQFAALPNFSVENAFALVQVCRQAGHVTTEVSVVEAVSQSFSTSSVVLSTRVYSALAGTMVRLGVLPPKLNPVVKPIMDSIKRETSEELQKCAAENLLHLILLVKDRTPCPTPKIIRNLISGLLEDKVRYPNIESSSSPFLFAQLASTPGNSTPAGGCNTPTTPSTPLSAPGDLMSQLATLSKFDGMISYVSHACSAGAKSGRGRGCKKEASPEQDPNTVTMETTRRGCVITLSHLASKLGERLLLVLEILEKEVFGVLEEQEEVQSSEEVQLKNKVISGLYVLDSFYPSLHPTLKEKLLLKLPTLSALLVDRYTAVRHAAVRLFTTLAKHDTVTVMNYLLSDTVKELESAECHKRQGVTECIHSIVKKLDLTVVPYVVLLVVPMLRRMGDSAPDIRSLATLTFAQLVKLMPLDGAKGEVPGLREELAAEKVKQKNFLEQLMDPRLIKDCEVPIKINAKLRKYQQDGVNWLWFLCQFGLHGILCDDMGLGKTLQTLCIIGTAHYNRLKSHPDEKPLPSLVVCPPTLIGHWFLETEKFISSTDLSPIMYNGTSAERVQLQQVVRTRRHDLVICSYDVLRNDSEFFAELKWNYCVLDEGHVIKNTKTKVSQAIRGMQALHRLILSGTPIQNNVLELWGLFDWLMPGFLGSERQFNETYSKPINQSRDPKSATKDQEAGALAMESLHRQVLPFLLRRMKEDVLNDLPPKIIQDYYCTLTPLQKQLYDEYSERVESADLKSESEVHVFQSLQFLRKICNHPILMLPKTHEIYPKLEGAESHTYSGKLMALNQLLLDCGIGSQVVSPHRALVFCQLKSMLDVVEKCLLKQHMPNVSYLRMDGSTPAAERVPLVNRFNSDPSYDLLLLTTSVGGLGLNLTGADTVIFVEHDWNPSKDLQAMDRAHRIGQKKVVNVYRLITKDTLEEKIMGLQKFKMNIANTVITSENSSLQQMGNSGLLDLLNGSESKKNRDKKSDQGKKGLAAVLSDIGDLWEDDEYEKEYDIRSFQESLHGEKTDSSK